jgi:hypothetical protein
VRAAVFSAGEIQSAVLFALAVEVIFALGLTLAGAASAVPVHEVVEERAMPIAVTPVLDEEALLKKGRKLDKAKLPDMWRKQPPRKVLNERSAPSTQADKTPEAIPSSQVAKSNEEAPKPEDETTDKPVDELADPNVKEDLNVEEEGFEEGVEEGKQTDPLKVNAVAMYTAKLSAWFKRGFNVPPDTIPCEELKNLRATAEAVVGPDLFVTSVRLVAPSGNALFDGHVTSAINNKVGQAVPPPPPLYPDILQSVIRTEYRSSQCD